MPIFLTYLTWYTVRNTYLVFSGLSFAEENLVMYIIQVFVE